MKSAVVRSSASGMVFVAYMVWPKRSPLRCVEGCATSSDGGTAASTKVFSPSSGGEPVVKTAMNAKNGMTECKPAARECHDRELLSSSQERRRVVHFGNCV